MNARESVLICDNDLIIGRLSLVRLRKLTIQFYSRNVWYRRKKKSLGTDYHEKSFYKIRFLRPVDRILEERPGTFVTGVALGSMQLIRIRKVIWTATGTSG